MNSASNNSGTTHTTMTLLDYNGSSIGEGSISSNGHNDNFCGESATSSISSRAPPSDHSSEVSSHTAGIASDAHYIFIYTKQDFMKYRHSSGDTCEDILIYLCSSMHILPTTRLLFGLRVHDSDSEWAVPGKPLRPDVRYCLRLRFKMPALDSELLALDANAYEYLYRQMRYDMVREAIPGIRYPDKKDNIMGLGVVDMYIDLVEERYTAERIEGDYKRYLPRRLVKAHKLFVQRKINTSFRQFRSKNIELGRVKWNYVHEIHNLDPNYMMEIYTAVVDYLPGDDQGGPVAPSDGTNGSHCPAGTHVFVKLDLYDTPEPGMKISRVMAADKLKWTLVAKLDNIYALYTEGTKYVRLEITGFPNAYRMQFERSTEMESFITYLAGYIRLTSKWMLDLCVQYPTPSLQELKQLRCHGPIGGSFSFAKIRDKRDHCGSYIIRQCEREYDTFFIDMNTKSSGSYPKKGNKTETFKIKKGLKWMLYINDSTQEFENLTDLAHSIPTETEHKFRIPPSEYDKPPQLLICLPKNMQSKKTETALSEAELQRKRVQILNPKLDFRIYQNSQRDCDNGKMTKMQADWIQKQGSYADVCVTLKALKSDADFPEFMKLANDWSQIYSPQFIKLFGLTLSPPYTMIMEHSKYGPLNEFLLHFKDKVTIRSLLDVVHGLVRGIVYLQECNLKHGYIRCSSLYVTKFNPKTNLLEAKISDPGFPRPYHREEYPWIPFEYYNDMNAAKEDPFADLWAFATTVWEIFARGQPIKSCTPEALRRNYNKYGGILPPPGEDCPDEMYRTMMDGWSIEADRRFNHQEIFSRLIFSKETLTSNYASVDLPAEEELDTSSIMSEFGNINEAGFLNNGHNYGDVQSSAFSGNSTTCDRAPLLRNQQSLVRNQLGNAGVRNFFGETASVLKIPNGKIIYKKVIGEGHYGTVYLGEIRYDSPNRESEQVAIKTIKSFKQLNKLNKDFMREIQIMQALDHPNIVKIKLWVEQPLSIIMEYFECGSFNVYLTSRKPNLTNEKLLHFALDIAEGMDYLRNQKVIHRDLAARNILVDRDRVKISDFGLAQIANADGYYFAQSAREIPIKWYSPESIKTNKFSFQSDVWSYGVTLFEMFSRGETPNLDPEQEITQEEFLNRLESGDRLRKPAQCTDIVYEKLMLRCWHANPKLRPDFKDLMDEIKSIMQEESGEGI